MAAMTSSISKFVNEFLFPVQGVETRLASGQGDVTVGLADVIAKGDNLFERGQETVTNNIHSQVGHALTTIPWGTPNLSRSQDRKEYRVLVRQENKSSTILLRKI